MTTDTLLSIGLSFLVVSSGVVMLTIAICVIVTHYREWRKK